MRFSGGNRAEDKDSLESYLSEDPTQPQEAIMLTSETGALWDAKTDAYVIRGQRINTNNITISFPQPKVTIYLMDLE